MHKLYDLQILLCVGHVIYTASLKINRKKNPKLIFIAHRHYIVNFVLEYHLEAKTTEGSVQMLIRKWFTKGKH